MSSGVIRRTAILATILSAGLIAAAEPARGPLRVHPSNPRYFTDGSGRAVYLAGSHTWTNLVDRGPSDPPPAFDFEAYLDLLEQHRHNFIRLWGRHVSWYQGYGEGILHGGPLAWMRTGPGAALDGKPRFDLTRPDPAYFERLRARVVAARDRGIYVSVMLFGGAYECRGGWRGNPFHARNNVNGIDGDPSGDEEGLETQTLAVPAITRIQEAYVRRVIETVNDLPNVLFEISNESEDASADWQRHLVGFIRKEEESLPQRHPVGMTALWSASEESNRVLAESPADWISPHTQAWGGVLRMPAADGARVSILDSDHWFVVELYRNPELGRDWVWRAFCRGHNPILMEHLPPLSAVMRDHPLSLDDPGYIASRRAMGQTRRWAERMDLAAMAPRGDLATSGDCLARPGEEYLIYVREGGEVGVDLPPAKGPFRVEWADSLEGTLVAGEPVPGGGRRSLRAPFAGPAVLHLQAEPPPRSIGEVPEALRRERNLSPFYKKYVDAGGIAVVSSEKPADHALLEAAHLIERMLAHRPDLHRAMAKNGARVAVMAVNEFTTDIPEHAHLSPKPYADKRARGMGGPGCVSCGEENLLGLKGDPYATENILIHEFGHGIHQGMRAVDESFGRRLREVYQEAMAAGRWKGSYAATNAGEYWAEGVQSWFDTNRENDPSHNHVNTREELKAYDPPLAKLLEEVLGDLPWRYRRPADRSEPGHLMGFDRARAPAFAWPAELLEWNRLHAAEVESGRRRGGTKRPEGRRMRF